MAALPPLDPRFITLLQSSVPAGTEALLCEALDAPSPVSLRLHPHKAALPPEGQLPPALAQLAPYVESPVPWCAHGRYLSRRPSFTLDPAFHAGAYYVQEASSMYLSRLQAHLPAAGTPDATRPYTVLDLCAAPGGKTTLLADLLPPGGLLVANEVIRSRVGVLVENVVKWGCPRTVVLNKDPKDLGEALPQFFDCIVADVPCSGEGMFRKDPAARSLWSPDLVQLCAARGQRLLAHIWPALRPGGLLVYSTCTFNHFEDEDQVAWIAEQLGADCLEQRKFLPGQDRGEGFFMAILRKHPAPGKDRFRPRKPEKIKAFKGEPTAWLQGDFVFQERGEGVRALPADVVGAVARIEERCPAVFAGVGAAQAKGRGWQPHPYLAWSLALRPEAFPAWEVDKATALQFLGRQNLVAEAGLPQGPVLLRHAGLPLGFIHKLPNRANNLYPLNWRILKSLS